MKINRHGKAKILTQLEIQLLFNHGLIRARERVLFSVCLFTACRIAEACQLLTADVYNRSGQARAKLILRKESTKGKLATRSIPVIADLRSELTKYYQHAGQVYLFPGRFGDKYLHPDSAARILRTACRDVGIEGVSTHSFRRTALTSMSDAGYPLRVIQKVSGHRDLGQLQEYLEVRDEQVLGAVSALSMLSPLVNQVGKYQLSDFNPTTTAPQQPERQRRPRGKNQRSG